MGKIILTETQYKRFKSILIENTINQTLLNEIGMDGEPMYEPPKLNQSVVNQSVNTNNSGELSYTVQSTDVAFENAEDPDYPELKIFKGAKFVPSFKNGVFSGKLYANTKFQFVNSANGEVTMGPATNDEPYDENNKYYTNKDNVFYNCAKGKFSVPAKSQYQYYAEDAPAPALQTELNKLCARSKNQKTSYGAESVGGGKSYAQQNDYVLTSDSGKTIKIPKGTGYAYKADKKGATFKLPGNKFGWFGCPSKIFLVDNVKYKDTKGFLANNIVKAICEVAPQEKQQQTQQTQQTQQYRSSGPKQVVGQGGGGSSEYSEYI
jgi:hypothetical protein